MCKPCSHEADAYMRNRKGEVEMGTGKIQVGVPACRRDPQDGH